MNDRDSNISKLANIVGGYRQDELKSRTDEERIANWLAQFDERAQDVIIEETAHVFGRLYYDWEKIDRFLESIIQRLLERSDGNGNLDDYCFYDAQKEGLSQTKLVSRLLELAGQNHGLLLDRTPSERKTKFVYIDDGLFTGSHLVKDFRALLKNLPENSTFEAVFIFGYISGIKYAREELRKLAKSKSIGIVIIAKEKMNNRIYSPFLGDGIIRLQDWLWPDDSSEREPSVERYASTLDGHGYPIFRDKALSDLSQIFSSEGNREILEREFLLKGIEILSSIENSKGLRPLGYSPYDSLGFGAFCASDINVPNTCPLALWWSLPVNGKDWVPLFPRRVGSVRSAF